MTGHGGEAGAVTFGFDPLWLSTFILIATYAVLLSEKSTAPSSPFSVPGLWWSPGLLPKIRPSLASTSTPLRC